MTYSQPYNTQVVVVAGGSGVRMGADCRKQYLEIDGRAILSRTLSVFDNIPSVSQIILVVPQSDIEFCNKKIVPEADLKVPCCVIAGGQERQDSVYNGLLAVSPGCDVVLIHDGVRPCITLKMVCDVADTAAEKGACIPALPVVDTVKYSASGGQVTCTKERDGLYLSQTPQGFLYQTILHAHQNARKTGQTATDDAELIEQSGGNVYLVEGSRMNIKITRPEDLPLATLFVQNMARDAL